MREIKFRGKRLDNGEWIEGYVYCGDIYGRSTDINNAVEVLIINNDCDEWEVIKETVGQFTGLKDKNGKEIYEWDIVCMHQFLFDGNEYENMLIGKIIYQETTMSYCLTNLSHEQIQKYMGYKDDYTNFQKECVPFDCFYGLHDESFEVIGNIHDNPELLQ